MAGARLVALFLTVTSALAAQPCCEWAERIEREVREAAYPELASADIVIRPFLSPVDYFHAGFDAARFVTGRKMRYVIRANPLLVSRRAPEDGLRAIVAHELAHVAYYNNGPRVRLFGMLRMLSPRWRSGFERSTDREAIRRGFGPGLKLYREWLYRNVPADKLPEKMRDYLSPGEIDALMHP